MRKGLILTERDYEILKHLVVGLATVNNNFEHSFKSDNGHFYVERLSNYVT